MERPTVMEETFLKAYDDHADELFRHALFRVRDRDGATDLVQETFVRTWNHLVEGGTVENFRPFLFQILRRLLIDGYRKKTTDSLDALLDNGFAPAAPENTMRDAEMAEVLAVIDGMDEDDRELLLLRFIDGFEPKEIAATLGVTANVVSVRLDRALKKVRDRLHIIRP